MHVDPSTGARIATTQRDAGNRPHPTPLNDVSGHLAELFGLKHWRRRLLARAYGDVLEVAIGSGKNLEYYPLGCRITGVDASEVMLQKAKARAASLSLHASFEVMDARRLGFPDESFDTVVDTLGICSQTDQLVALRELSRVCRRSGQVLLLEHARSRQQWLGKLQDRQAARHAKLFGCAWNREPLELVQASGLRILHEEQHFMGIFRLVWATKADR
jgi:ubiquinone/menaquinone biosynthesis C-methylase UbiE